MSGAPIRWLPESALLDARTAEPVARCIQAWAGEWFAATRPDLPPRWERQEPETLEMGFSPAFETQGFRIALREDGRVALAAQLLGRELSERDLRTAQDRVVIDHLVEEALQALGTMLGNAMPTDSSGETASFALPVHSPSGELLLRIEAGPALLTTLALGWAESPRKRAALARRKAALAAQPLRLSARIGASRLALAQIEALGPGDVLTLHTPLTAALDALIDDAPAATGALGLVPGESDFQLQLTRPATQW
ncbi:MAG TPA: FliM/FliN family flagellar motor C-terminal domain-containing protein [Sphingomonadaceae bacterium]|nr:FliM/FliN family flagellar motor C-terminal domain-containing protein [Sphingomonadaceae bacterium]